MFDPSCSIETCKPATLQPPTSRKINLEEPWNLSTSSTSFTFSTDPCQSELGSIRILSSLRSALRSTCPKSQPLPLTACDGAENIFPSFWLWWISQSINHTTKEKKKAVWNYNSGTKWLVKAEGVCFNSEPKSLMKCSSFTYKKKKKNHQNTVNDLQRLKLIFKMTTSPTLFAAANSGCL